MNSIDVQIKSSAGDTLALTFTAGDAPHAVAEKIATILWIVRQASGQPVEPRRRGPRAEREPAASGAEIPGKE